MHYPHGVFHITLSLFYPLPVWVEVFKKVLYLFATFVITFANAKMYSKLLNADNIPPMGFFFSFSFSFSLSTHTAIPDARSAGLWSCLLFYHYSCYYTLLQTQCYCHKWLRFTNLDGFFYFCAFLLRAVLHVHRKSLWSLFISFNRQLLHWA